MTEADDVDVEPERFARAREAMQVINVHCHNHLYFSRRLFVPGAQLSSVPFYCSAVHIDDPPTRVKFYFCLDPELDIFRVDPEVREVARECVRVALDAVPGIRLLQHVTELTHAGVPPVDPASIEPPPLAAARRHVEPAPPETAAEIATAFFRNWINANKGFVDEIRAEIPHIKTLAPFDVDFVLWAPHTQSLTVHVGIHREDLNPWEPPEVVQRLVAEGIERLRARHPETAGYPIRVFYEK